MTHNQDQPHRPVPVHVTNTDQNPNNLPNFLLSVHLKYVKLGYRYLISNALYILLLPLLAATIASLSSFSLNDLAILYKHLCFHFLSATLATALLIALSTAYFTTRPRRVSATLAEAHPVAKSRNLVREHRMLPTFISSPVVPRGFAIFISSSLPQSLLFILIKILQKHDSHSPEIRRFGFEFAIKILHKQKFSGSRRVIENVRRDQSDDLDLKPMDFMNSGEREMRESTAIMLTCGIKDDRQRFLTKERPKFN